MNLVKTQAGQRVMKDRSVPLTFRQRAAFIFFDGRHSVEYVLAATRSFGVTGEDIRHLIELGLLEEAPDPRTEAARRAAQLLRDRTPQQRYQDAYPIATQLTAALGLKGFRLNLAVERASGYEELRELAPRIRDAVGEAAFAPLESALNA